MTPIDKERLETWDWSLNNCELARLHGLTAPGVRYIRRRLGLPATDYTRKVTLDECRNWDWSLSNCELGRRYGMTSQAVWEWRRKLGLERFKATRREEVKGVDRSTSKRPPHQLSKDEFDAVWEERFWRNIIRMGERDCWMWTGLVCEAGYGRFYARKKTGNHGQYQSHRMAYMFTHGSVPANLIVLHSCDVKGCNNPNHLSVGTDFLNAVDASVKGLMHPGVKTFGAVLNDDLVRTIRYRNARGEKINDIARNINHNRRTVADVVNRKTWRHV